MRNIYSHNLNWRYVIIIYIKIFEAPEDDESYLIETLARRFYLEPATHAGQYLK